MKKYLPHIIIVLGSLSWILTMFKSGLQTEWGMGFWGANGHDGIWHVALANSLARGSLRAPTYAGFPLQNYHIGFDLLLALLSKTGIPVLNLYFQILPVIFALLIGFFSYKFVHAWTTSKSAAFWSTFFVYFGGSFGYLVTLVRGEGIGGESLFWSQQSISTLINPPFALSLLILLISLLFFLQEKKNNKRVFTIIFLFSLLLSIKVYLGVLLLCSLFIVSIFELFTKKRFFVGKLFLGSLIFSFVLFIPLNRSAGQLIVFQPGWFLETMLALSDRFYWPKLFEALINWRAGHIYAKAIGGYIVAFILFFVGNIGTRIVAFYVAKPKSIRIEKIKEIDLLLVLIAIGGVTAPMMFLQAGTAWNTIQFFYYSLFILSLYAGVGVSKILSSVKFQKVTPVITVIILILTVPTSISTLAQVYIPSRPPARLSQAEQEGLSFLSRQPEGIVLTYPYDPLKAKEAISNPPRPLYLYESTAYVTAFGKHPVFLEDEVNLTIMNYQWKQRRADLDAFYKSTDQKRVYNFLRDNNIRYIYWVKPQFTQIGDLQLRLTNIFENKEVVIYEVEK